MQPADLDAFGGKQVAQHPAAREREIPGIATRYDKNPDNYLAGIKLVATRIWCQNL